MSVWFCLRQNMSLCTTIHVKRRSAYRFISMQTNSFSFERFYSRSRFETEEQARKRFIVILFLHNLCVEFCLVNVVVVFLNSYDFFVTARYIRDIIYMGVRAPSDLGEGSAGTFGLG